MKKLVIALLCACSISVQVIVADWLDDIAHLAGQLTCPTALLPVKRAQKIIELQLLQDIQHIGYLEKQKSTLKTGWWATIHKGTFELELATAKTEKNYHEKVARTLAQLHENKKEHRALTQHLKELAELQTELAKLQLEYHTNTKLIQKVSIGGKIAKSKAFIAAKKGRIKSLFLAN